MAGAESSVSMAENSTEENQASEVALVKSYFPSGCRVVANSGQFSHVVTVQPKNMDATIKFQLSHQYPSVIPEITVRSESISKINIHEVVEFLKTKAQSLHGHSMLLTLIKEAEKKFREFGLRPGKTSKVEEDTILDKKKVKPKKQKRKHRSEDEIDENVKLPPMKTSDDVVKRIIWDESLEKDEFVVGYIDRFRGLVEKYFSAFSWEDLASVDYDVLAIPKHRIQYFSYKGVKVWDKIRRVDNVFGSASGTKTIDVVMREIQEAENAEQTSTDNIKRSPRDEDEDSDSSDSDDGFEVTIRGACGIGLTQSSAKACPDMENKEGEFDPYWQDKLRPNYFLCVRITNERIIDQIGNIQDHLMQVEPLFGECCISGASLHMTLNVLGLDTPEQVKDCVDVLNKVKPDIAAALPKSLLKFNGVSNFYNRVIYAKVQYENDFMVFHSALKQLLSQNGVQIRDGYEFVPHVTIMKTTRPVSRLRGSKNIEPQIYQQFLDLEMGEQKIDSIYLCSMGNDRREDGFYLTPTEIHFDTN